MSNAGYKVLHPKAYDAESLARERFALDVLMGLSQKNKKLPSKYFYDTRGSDLFSQITHLKEYYPTQCEFEILQKHKGSIAKLMRGKEFSVIELGAGDGRKTKVLIKEFLAAGLKFKYIPVDISESAVSGLMKTVMRTYPQLKCSGIVAEYFDALRWLSRTDTGNKLILFLGSNIGNFDLIQARVFLRTMWNALNVGDYVFTGFDLKKDFDVMLNAYNDSKGVTAAFNLNLLRRINRELGGTFDLKSFQHFSTYNVFSGAMESYIISLKHQTVEIGALNKKFFLEAFEPIHTEYSYKFLPGEIDILARETGFHAIANYYDAKKYFLDTLWQVKKIKREARR